MQWNGSKNAGFSSAEQTWLPIHKNYSEVNVENQLKDEFSLLKSIRDLMNVRRHEISIREGVFNFIEGLPDEVLGFSRVLGSDRVLIYLNFGKTNLNFKANGRTMPLFKLSREDDLHEFMVHLKGYGGIILKEI